MISEKEWTEGARAEESRIGRIQCPDPFSSKLQKKCVLSPVSLSSANEKKILVFEKLCRITKNC